MTSNPGQFLHDDDALRHVRSLARAHDPDPEHCFQVARLSEDLFHATRDVHHLTSADLRLLVAAALLHDTGYALNPQNHHKGSRDFIMGADIPDFSTEERMTIACVARYHRGGDPKAEHKVFRDLAANEQVRVTRLAALLRIADGLDRGHDAACREVRMEREGDEVELVVRQRAESDIDLWGGNRKKGLFERIFGVTVTIRKAPMA